MQATLERLAKQHDKKYQSHLDERLGIAIDQKLANIANIGTFCSKESRERSFKRKGDSPNTIGIYRQCDVADDRVAPLFSASS